MTTNTEEQAKTEAAAPAKEQKGGKKASVAATGAPCCAGQGEVGEERPPPAKKRTQKAGKRAKATGAREGSKTAKVLELLKRPGGARAKELMKATGWLSHSVRGFLSGTVGKKMGLAVTSAKREDGQRSYSVKG